MPGLFSAIALFIKELTLLVSYVKNNAFPQPLTEKEEARHLKLFAEGNAHSRNTLIEHNLRLVAHIVKKFDNTGEDLEDLISIGTIGLIKAIESFQTGKGTKLATLDEREKEVVIGRFGLEAGGEERTQREIARELGISRSYVSRIEKRALMKLYHEFYKQKG